VVNILVKALASVPFPDFNLSIALLDDKASSANVEEPDPLPGLLPYLINMHGLLQQCRFPAFWSLYRSDALESLRDNYTVEVVGFEDSIREVAVRAVKATFQKIGSKRLGSYLDLEGSLADRCHSFATKTDPCCRGGIGRVHCKNWLEVRHDHRRRRRTTKSGQPDRIDRRTGGHQTTAQVSILSLVCFAHC
jgi:CSN8/PSMD8/EIF3K family